MENLIRKMRRARRVSQETLGAALGIRQPTVSKIESGESSVSLEQLHIIAETLGCRVSDLVHEPRPTIAVAGRVGAGAQVPLVDAYTKGDGLYHVACPTEISPHGVVAVEVEGDSMIPTYHAGDVLFFSRATHEGVPVEDIGRICVCEDAEGMAWVKYITTGTSPGLFNLISLNPLIPNKLDQRLKWAARVRLALPAELVERA